MEIDCHLVCNGLSQFCNQPLLHLEVRDLLHAVETHCCKQEVSLTMGTAFNEVSLWERHSQLKYRAFVQQCSDSLRHTRRRDAIFLAVNVSACVESAVYLDSHHTGRSDLEVQMLNKQQILFSTIG